MDSVKVGIIGGSGIYNLDGVKIIDEIKVDTPFGTPSSEIVLAKVNGYKCYFLPRHGKAHSLTPSEVNYRANIYALKSLGVSYLLSISAVGSLKEELRPGMFVFPDQFIDWTKGLRQRTFFGNGVVGHVSAANPVNLELQKIAAEACEESDVEHSVGGSYICIEGPQFSSRAESEIYRSFGASIIGMTNVPESYLAKEANMAYATMAMVTDYDCWKDEACSVEEIMKVLKKNNENAQKVVAKYIPKISENLFNYPNETEFSIMSSRENMTDDQRKICETLTK